MSVQPIRRSLLATTSGALVAELIGTFMFTFAGTATVLAVHKLSKTATGFTAVDDIAVSIAFGFGLLAAVYVVAQVSGAHVNPAVTLALAAIGRFPWRIVPAYVVAQFIGGLLAGLMDWFMFGGTLRETLILGSTHPGPSGTAGRDPHPALPSYADRSSVVTLSTKNAPPARRRFTPFILNGSRRLPWPRLCLLL